MNRFAWASIPLALFMVACQQGTVLPPEPIEKIEEVVINASSPDKADIGSLVWFDTNRDGIRQASEFGVDDVKVSLWTDINGDNNPDDFVVSMLTKQGGLYRFNALDPNINYIVHIDTQAFHFSPQNSPDAPNSSYDSDVDVTGLSSSIEVEAGIFTHTVNAGLVEPRGNLYPKGTASIGNKVWIDDGDGVKQEPEPGFYRVLVNLWLDEGKDGVVDKKVASTWTDFGGYYMFNDLAKSAHFYVEVVAPIGYTFAPKNSPSAGTKNRDSDFNENGFTDLVVFEDGARFHHWIDAGLVLVD